MIGAVLAVTAGATLLVVSHSTGAHALASQPTTTTSTAPSTTTTAPPTTTTIKLPQPTPPPANPYANVPVNQIGTILIPNINLVSPVFEGVWLTVVDHGPGHWPGSAVPGQIGNSVFAGHRVTHTHPFLNLDQLAVGDQVIFAMPNGVFTYAVTSITIVLPTDIGITDPTNNATITLFACNPKHSAAQRIVVQGKLISSRLTKPAPAAKTSSV
ncbi:MAG: sortase [Acidimicrobiia bacterium]